MMVVLGAILVATTVLMTAMRRRTTSTQTEDGTWVPTVTPTASANAKSKAEAKAKSKAEAKAQPKSRAREPTATEDWLGETFDVPVWSWLLESEGVRDPSSRRPRMVDRSLRLDRLPLRRLR